MRTPWSSLPFLAVGLLLLAGCGAYTPGGAAEDPVETVVPASPDASDGSTGGTAPSATVSSGVDCVDDRVLFAGSALAATIDTDCERVELQGNDLDVDLAGRIGRLVVRGDRNDVSAGAVEAVEIEGQDNEVEMDAAQDAALTGDRNDLDVDGAIERVVVRGTENHVAADTLGTVVDEGARNRIELD